MPSSLIEIRRHYRPEDETRLIDAVQGALIAAFRIPESDRNVRLLVHEPSRFACSPRLSQPEFATVVSIDCIVGRSVDAKRALYREIVDRLAVVGIPPDHVVVMLREISQENWGIRGGQAACDVELGFEVAV